MDPTQAQPADPQKKPVPHLKWAVLTFAGSMLVLGVLVVAGRPTAAPPAPPARVPTAAEVAQVRPTVERLAAEGNKYRAAHSGTCPDVPTLQRATLVEAGFGDVDAWGRPYTFLCETATTTARSDGPSKESASDDIVAPAAYRSNQDQFADALAAQKQVSGAWHLAKRHVKDGLELDLGKTTLLAWSGTNLRWPDLQSVPETTFGKVMKDVEPERGKRICRSGLVGEIVKGKELQMPYFTGGLVNDAAEVLRFYAVRSTGEIVQGSRARFCGLVTGVAEYDNVSHTTTQAVVAVGMFDLPENKK